MPYIEQLRLAAVQQAGGIGGLSLVSSQLPNVSASGAAVGSSSASSQTAATRASVSDLIAADGPPSTCRNWPIPTISKSTSPIPAVECMSSYGATCHRWNFVNLITWPCCRLRAFSVIVRATRATISFPLPSSKVSDVVLKGRPCAARADPISIRFP